MSEAGTRAALLPAEGDPDRWTHLLSRSTQDPETLFHWRQILDSLNVPHAEAREMLERAARNGTSFHAELAHSGLVSEDQLAAALADVLGLAFIREIEASRLLIPAQHQITALRGGHGGWIARYDDPERPDRILVSPEGIDLAGARRLLARSANLPGRLAVVPASALRRAMIAQAAPSLTERARSSLLTTYPQLSAQTVGTGAQGFAMGLLAGGVVLAFYASFWAALHVLHYATSFFFLACVLLRAYASGADVPARHGAVAAPAARTALPRYSVLVALHREAAIAQSLVAAMAKLDWPASLIEIKFVCEADDRGTIEALQAARLRPNMEVIEVPPSQPRTKPKALNFALPLTRGDYVVLYDAEDRPHPGQLLEAYHRFSREDDSLACLQAPLMIANAGRGWLQRMFAVEYAGLFRTLLPVLARHRLVLPLGGTSNHFRRATLERVLAWDPYNVTEDADLGIRLARFGYRCGTISLPTLEDAPERIRVWIPQRTRWLKGWTVTWLVHMRQAASFRAEVGALSFLVTQIMMAGMVLSCLTHPALVLTLTMLTLKAYSGTPLAFHEGVLVAVDVVNIACGYTAFLVLGWRSLSKPERRGFWRVVAATPVYWMMMSWAAWRALWQLRRSPHLWEKTPHFAPQRRG